MLFIVYGGTGELRKRCRDFFLEKNFLYVKKYSALLKGYLPKTKYEQRELLSVDELRKKCDFFYEITEYDIQVGFEQSQIIDAARGVSPVLATAEDGVQMMKILDAIYCSAQEGREVVID